MNHTLRIGLSGAALLAAMSLSLPGTTAQSTPAADFNVFPVQGTVSLLIGPDGKVKHYFPKVDARGFPTEALKLL